MSKAFNVLSGALDEVIADAESTEPALKHETVSLAIFKANEQEVFDMVSFKWDNQRALEIAHEEAKQETRCEVALDMLKHDFPINLVASISKLSLEQLRKLAQAHHLTVIEG